LRKDPEIHILNKSTQLINSTNKIQLKITVKFDLSKRKKLATKNKDINPISQEKSKMSSPLQVMQNCVSAFLHGLMNEKSIPIEIIGKC